MIEQTFIIIKPDAIARELVGVIIKKFEKEGLIIDWIGSRRKDVNWVKEHYAGNPHLTEEMIDFMVDFLIGIVLSGENAIKRVREMVGNVTVPALGTIRWEFYAIGFRNLIHAADSKEAVTREFTLFTGSVENEYS